MSIESNRNVLDTARRQFNAANVEAYITTLYAPDAVAHFLPQGMPQGHTGLRLYYSAFAFGFPDAQLHLDDFIEEGDKLAVRYHLDATHLGEFNGIPATNGRVSFSGITTMRFVDGKVVERWSQADLVGLMQQLGAIPSMAEP